MDIDSVESIWVLATVASFTADIDALLMRATVSREDSRPVLAMDMGFPILCLLLPWLRIHHVLSPDGPEAKS